MRSRLNCSIFIIIHFSYYKGRGLCMWAENLSTSPTLNLLRCWTKATFYSRHNLILGQQNRRDVLILSSHIMICRVWLMKVKAGSILSISLLFLTLPTNSAEKDIWRDWYSRVNCLSISLYYSSNIMDTFHTPFNFKTIYSRIDKLRYMLYHT